MRKEIVGALAAIGSIISYRLLVEILSEAEPAVKAEILMDMSDVFRDKDYRSFVSSEMTPLLIDFCRLPQQVCLYFDFEGREEDFRFWMFRAFQELRDPRTLECIEHYIETINWPVTTRAEAAGAHWRVTNDQKYVLIMREANKDHLFYHTDLFKEVAKAQRRQRKKITSGVRMKRNT